MIWLCVHVLMFLPIFVVVAKDARCRRRQKVTTRTRTKTTIASKSCVYSSQIVRMYTHTKKRARKSQKLFFAMEDIITKSQRKKERKKKHYLEYIQFIPFIAHEKVKCEYANKFPLVYTMMYIYTYSMCREIFYSDAENPL